MSSDLLDIRCPQCNRLYQLPAAQIGPKGRKLRCVACSLVFEFIPPAQPLDLVQPTTESSGGGATLVGTGSLVSSLFPTAPNWKQRSHVRETFHTRALMRLLPSGIEWHGMTQDISAAGAFLATNNDPTIDPHIKIGTTCITELILLEGKQPAFIEMLGKIVRITPDGVGIHFEPDMEVPKTPNLSMPMSPFTPRAYAKVYVRRSNGSLEEGWQILPGNALLPPTIARLFAERRQQSLVVVCRKRTPAGEGYKIYTVQELKEIQQDADSLGYNR
ncbi:MAG: PilZ domain-containing protein [Magnetococcales bacterium]|nr:PilZ domain-containing protein [Magnetococcales bacterium]